MPPSLRHLLRSSKLNLRLGFERLECRLNLAGDDLPTIYLHQDNEGVKDEVDTDDRFGAALAKGFFDADDLLDLAIAVPGEDGRGAVAILYNQHSHPWSVQEQLWSASTLLGNRTIREFGKTLAAGDFDGDGFDDLAIGAPDATINKTANAGLVAVLYGTAEGLSQERMQLWHQGSSGIPGVAHANDRFGAALVAADLGETEFDDLAIGVPYDFVDGSAGAGSVHVIYGSGFGLHELDNQFWRQDAVVDGVRVLGTPDQDDHFGFSLAGGDLNGDATTDLAIGIPGESVDSQDNAGAVAVLYGRKHLSLSAVNNELVHQGHGRLEGVAEPDDMFGYAVAIGNFLGDYRDDLAVGIPRQTINNVPRAGAVQVIPGDRRQLNDLADEIWHQDLKDLEKAESGDHFGSVLASARLTKYSHRNDLVVGVPEEDLESSDVGLVHVFRTDGTQSSGWSTAQTLRPSTYGLVEHENEQFGSALLAGHFDPFPDVQLGFNPEDLFIGIPNDEPTVGKLGGAVVGGDVIRPSVTIVQTPNITDLRFDIDFSEYVYGFTLDDIILDGPPGTTIPALVRQTTSTSRGASAPFPDGSFFRLRVEGMETIGEISLRVDQNAAYDALGNGNLRSKVATHLYDAPVTAYINRLDEDEEEPVDEMEFQVSISHRVNEFTAEHVEVTGPVQPEWITVEPTDHPRIFIITLGGLTQSGYATLTIFPDVAPSTLRFTKRFQFKFPVPATPFVHVTHSPTAVKFQIEFDQELRTFDTSRLLVGGTANPTSVAITQDGNRYLVQVTGMNQDGTVTLQVPPDVVETVVRTGNVESDVVSVDYRQQFVTVKVSRREEESNEEQAVFDVRFSEPVIGLEPSDFWFEPVRPGDIQIQGEGANYRLVVRDFPADSTPTHKATVWSHAVSPPNHSSNYVPPEERRYWTNPFDPMDVNGDGIISSIDALIIINHLNREDAFDWNVPLPLERGPSDDYYMDPNGDERITPIDVVMIINTLNERR